MMAKMADMIITINTIIDVFDSMVLMLVRTAEANKI
jgi:hypothetical protein